MKRFNITVNGKSYDVAVEEVGGAAPVQAAPAAAPAPAPAASAPVEAHKPKIRFCDQCGAKITSETAKFCAECGNKLIK